MLKRPLRFNRRIIFLISIALLITGVIANLKLGVVDFSISDLKQDSADYHIIFNIRTPRVLLSALVGMSLAISGAILQGVLRNPIADPSIIGISAGAGLFAISVMILLPEHTAYVPPIAFVGALTASVIVYSLAWRGGISPLGLVLAGVAVGAFFGGLMTLLMVFHSDKVQGVINWLAGGLQGRSWGHLKMMLPYSVVGTIIALLLSSRVNILLLGDDIARGLGMRVELTRLSLIATSALLAASAVCVSGLLGFVGLIAPHMVRLIVGGDNRYVIPLSGLFGANLMVYSDMTARVAFSPIEVPVGVFMALLGSPFFLYLLKRTMAWRLKG